MTEEKIGLRIKKIRTHFNKKQKDLADDLKTSQKMLSEYETNKRMPGGDFLQKFCEYFDINAHWLLTGQDQMFLKKADTEKVTSESERIKELKGVIADKQGVIVDKQKIIGFLEAQLATQQQETIKWKNRYLEVQADLTTLQNEQREAAEQRRANR